MTVDGEKTGDHLKEPVSTKHMSVVFVEGTKMTKIIKLQWRIRG